jgi:hypothetical protein
MSEWPTKTDDGYSIQASSISLDKCVNKVLKESSNEVSEWPTMGSGNIRLYL